MTVLISQNILLFWTCTTCIVYQFFKERFVFLNRFVSKAGAKVKDFFITTKCFTALFYDSKQKRGISAPLCYAAILDGCETILKLSFIFPHHSRLPILIHNRIQCLPLKIGVVTLSFDKRLYHANSTKATG